jgi:hypothetical protein
MDYTNERVREIYTRTGEYKAPQLLKDGVRVDNKELSPLENNAKYFGQWSTSSNMRHGEGTQVWSDGSMY